MLPTVANCSNENVSTNLWLHHKHPQTVNLISCQEGASSHPLCTSHLSFLRLRVLQPLVWFWSVARACGRCAFQVLNISHSIQDILQPCHVAASVFGKTESAIRVEALAIPSLNLIHPCSIIYFLSFPPVFSTQNQTHQGHPFTVIATNLAGWVSRLCRITLHQEFAEPRHKSCYRAAGVRGSGRS